MSTDAQIAANRENAKSSIGPATDAGKARSARNAASFGLFSAPGFAPPGEEEHYAHFRKEYGATLAPEGALENTLAAEIIHAAWRLRRCVQIEANFDKLEREGNLIADPAALEAVYVETRAEALLRSIHRARAGAQRTLHRSIAELRRLQTERRFRHEFLPKNFDLSGDRLSSFKEVIPVMASSGVQQQLSARNGGSFVDLLRKSIQNPLNLENDDLTDSIDSNFAERSQSPESRQSTPPRNAPCRCGSGLKFKRCGKTRTYPSPGIGMAA